MPKRKKILLVEDNRLTQLVVADLLHDNGYVTETAVTGEEAVQKISGGFWPDLVLMDIDLPGSMDGIDTARSIVKTQDIPVVFLTASTSREIFEKIKAVQGYGFIAKGTDKYALLSTVEMALQLHETTARVRMFELLFENSNVESYIFHPKSFKFIAVNRVATKNTGYTIEELNTMTLLDLKPEFDLKSFRKLINPLFSREQEQVLFETVLRRKDGSLYPAEMNIQLFDYRGVKLCLALVVDLTERRAMREELQEKEGTLSVVLGTARDAIIIIDEQGMVTFWNPAAEQLFGYSREEVLGKDLHRLLVPDERFYKVYKEAFERFQTTGKGDAIGKTIEVKARRKNGQELDVELSLSALCLRKAWYAVGIGRDISERKRIQAELENSRKQYVELAENAPIGIVTCDPEGRIIYTNQKTLEILGSPDIEETKKINLLTFPLLVSHGLSQKLQRCLQNNETAACEMEYESKWGKRMWLRIHIKPQVNRDRVTGAQVIIDDITERKQLEEELRHLSVTDDLTNAYNRRYFMRKLEEEIERSRRTGSKFSLIMLDIDHFKWVNDRFGHNAGDLVLKSVAAVIGNRLRRTDTLARWGGEEFVILLPETMVNDAAILAEELRESLSRMEIPGVGGITVSLGIAGYRPEDTVDTLIQRADDLMYEAKNAGRNCVRYRPE